MESSCLICGETFSPSSGVNNEGVGNLPLLLGILCEQLALKDLAEQIKSSLEGLQQEQQSVCCLKCYNLLRRVERVHEVIVAAKKEMSTYLTEVETLVAKSESHSLSCFLWNQCCFEFRRRIVEKLAKPDIAVAAKSVESIKEEFEDDLPAIHDQDPLLDDTFDLFLNNTQDDNLDRVRTIPDLLIKSEDDETVARSLHDVVSESQNITEKPTRRLERRKLSLALDPLTKRRKVSVEATSNRNEVRRTSSRVAKNSAEQALKKQYACNASDDDSDQGEVQRDEDYQENFENMEGSASEIGESDMEEKINVVPKRKPGRKKSGTKKSKESKTGKKMIRGEFYPFVVAGDNVFLYKWGTYVRFNYTHLQCQAHNCPFETEFDYQPSFQRMKAHIDENHRSRKHRQQTPHPCILCGKKCPNQEEFRKHIKSAHDFSLKSKAICECCLMHIRYAYTRAHMFSHKNEEEKAIAREKRDGSARCFQAKESEMDDSEKKYKCDFENCTYASKSGKNLRRHKQSHLSKDQRTDQAICTECGRQMLRESLATHMKRMHHPETVDRVLICPVCDKRFLPGDNANLQKHIRRHRNDKPFLCTECGSTFVGNAELTQHTQQVHSIQDPMKCDWCDKIFVKYRSLRTHVRRRHPENITVAPSKKKLSKFYYNEEEANAQYYGPIQQFPCQICEVVCKYRSTLKKHMSRFHTGNNNKISRNCKRIKSQKVKNKDPLEVEGSSNSCSTTQLPSSSIKSDEDQIVLVDANFASSSIPLFQISSTEYFGN